MYINGILVKGDFFAYDGCHKMYLLEDDIDSKEAKEYGYKIIPINLLKETYDSSCPLRFINNWKLTKTYVGQFEIAYFM